MGRRRRDPSGRSLIDTISEGLTSSTYVLILATADFLKPGWRQFELKAALSREIRTGAAVVIPLLDVDYSRFAERYPLLADKLSIDWRDGVAAVASKIAGLFPRQSRDEWHHLHPADHVGLVWVRVLPAAGSGGRSHRLTLRWGPYIRRIEFEGPPKGPVSFVHHKTAPDQVWLNASIEPHSIVTFDHGPPPGRPPVNIDEGWIRSSGGSWPGNL